MPFDDRAIPFSRPAKSGLGRPDRVVAGWLFAVAFMVFGMVVLGGATRATGSGLSIMEWAPVSGVLPPLSHAEWERLFDLYKRIPQYALLHDGMGLDGFQKLFWLEWAHRLWGRLIGLVFAVPLLWFWVRGRIGRGLWWRLAGLFALGGLQGAVGWFMVASGFFPDSTAVSPYRLVVHLSLALVLFATLVWTGLSVAWPVPAEAAARVPGRVRVAAWVATALVALTIVAGGFVAGTHAGQMYNTFPLMDGRLVPAGYAPLHPWVANLFQTIEAVQFDHRLLATATALVTVAALGLAWASPAARIARGAVLALGAGVAAQYALGVATLVYAVPLGLAVAHQANAVLVLTACLVLLHGLRRPIAG